MGNCRHTPAPPSGSSRAFFASSPARHDGENKEDIHHPHEPSPIPLPPHNSDHATHVSFSIRRIRHVPHGSIAERLNVSKNGYFIEVWAEDPASSFSKLACRTTTFNGRDEFAFEDTSEYRVALTIARLRIQLYASHFESSVTAGLSLLLAETTVSPSELITKRNWALYLFDPATDCLIFHDKEPMTVDMVVPNATEQVASPPPADSPAEPPPRHVMIFTRGTRGDVQPFVALSRGLAELKGWEVTIVTEMRYRDLVVKNSVVSRGKIRFRPSGGDTERRIDTPILKWAVHNSNATFQLLMLAKAEREFFDSEPAFYYFASTMRPGLILFTFTTATVSMIISEALRIPLMGFILQPTIIPSKRYPAIVPVGDTSMFGNVLGRGSRPSSRSASIPDLAALEHLPELPGDEKAVADDGDKSWERCDIANDAPIDNASTYTSGEWSMPGGGGPQSTTTASFSDPPTAATTPTPITTTTTTDVSHYIVGILKPTLENNIFTRRLNAMRAARGLKPTHTKEMDFSVLQQQRVPLIVPINSFTFGGRPDDWADSIVMTDYIYLSPVFSSSGKDPVAEALTNKYGQGITALQPALRDFIIAAKDAGAPIVSIAFSSMPVSRTAVLGLSSLVAERSVRGARIIALVGTRPKGETTDEVVQARASALAAQGKLIEVGGAPFGVLFPLCDFVIVHGGLGTTSEAFRAGKPCLVTGVLLLDQRFWGRKVEELGVGPAPVHVSHLKRVLVDIVDRGTEPGSMWAKNATMLARRMASAEHGDGIALNVETVSKLAEEARPMEVQR